MIDNCGELSNSYRIINYRPLFEIVIGLMLGIAVGSSSIANSVPSFLVALFVLMGLEFFVFSSKRMILFLFAIVVGVVSVLINTPMKISNGTHRIEGKIINVSYSDSDGTNRLIVKDVTVDGTKFNKKILIIDEGDKQLKVGDSIGGYAKIDDSLNMSDEMEKYYLSRGIGCIVTMQNVIRLGSNTLPFYQMIEKCRDKIESCIEIMFNDDSDTVVRLVMGENDASVDERTLLFRKTGIAHILAISGLHMSVIVSFIASIIKTRNRWVKISIICLFILLYCLLCVRSAGIIRAAIMTASILIADGFERRGDSLCALSLAAILILIFNPFQLYSIGFQLSFVACFGILMLAPAIGRSLDKCFVPSQLGISSTLAASVSTVMLQLHYFNTFSTYALLANIIAIPLYSLILLLALVLIILALVFMPGAQILACVPKSLIFVMDKLLGAISNAPYSVLNFKSPTPLMCVIWLIALFSVSDYVLRPLHKKLLYCCSAVALFTVIAFLP